MSVPGGFPKSFLNQRYVYLHMQISVLLNAHK